MNCRYLILMTCLVIASLKADEEIRESSHSKSEMVLEIQDPTSDEFDGADRGDEGANEPPSAEQALEAQNVRRRI